MTTPDPDELDAYLAASFGWQSGETYAIHWPFLDNAGGVTILMSDRIVSDSGATPRTPAVHAVVGMRRVRRRGQGTAADPVPRVRRCGVVLDRRLGRRSPRR